LTGFFCNGSLRPEIHCARPSLPRDRFPVQRSLWPRCATQCVIQSLVGEANLGVLTGHSRTIRGKSREPRSFSGSGLKIGESGAGSGVMSEPTLELADWMLFFDGKPVSAAMVGAGLLVKLQHFSLRIVELSSPLLERPLKLDRAFHAAKLQDYSNHPRDTLLLPEPKSRVIKPESLPTVKR